MKKMKVIQYSLTFLGTIEVSDDVDEEDIPSLIAEDYYSNGFDIKNANDVEWEVV